MSDNPNNLERAEPHRVLCLGDMTVDIVASPMARLPEPGEVALTDRISFFPGGNALNTAVALQRLGERVSFVGSLGDDPFGDLLLSELEKLGLDLRGVRREPGESTPITLIYRGEEEDRRFIHALGVADTFTGEQMTPDLIPDRGVLLVAGYLKLRFWNDDALVEVLKTARQRHCTVVLNVCIPTAGGVDPGRCLRLLPYVDVFVPNEDEARLLTGQTQLSAQARVFREAGVGAAIITRGAHGLYAEDGKRIIQMGVYTVPLVDPAGCGDCFTAGLIAGLLRRWDLVRTLELASAVGALGATALGCTQGVPPFAKVEAFLQQNKLDVSTQASSSLDI